MGIASAETPSGNWKIMVRGDHSSNARASVTIAHELGHLFGVEDYYNGNWAAGQVNECIWGSERYSTSVSNTLKICNYCKSIINANKNNFNHPVD